MNDETQFKLQAHRTANCPSAKRNPILSSKTMRRKGVFDRIAIDERFAWKRTGDQIAGIARILLEQNPKQIERQSSPRLPSR